MTAMLVPTMVVLCTSTMILLVSVAMICISIMIHIVMCMDAIRYTMTIILGQISNEDLNNTVLQDTYSFKKLYTSGLPSNYVS